MVLWLHHLLAERLRTQHQQSTMICKEIITYSLKFYPKQYHNIFRIIRLSTNARLHVRLQFKQVYRKAVGKK